MGVGHKKIYGLRAASTSLISQHGHIDKFGKTRNDLSKYLPSDGVIMSKIKDKGESKKTDRSRKNEMFGPISLKDYLASRWNIC